MCLYTHVHQIKKHLILYEQLYLGFFLYQNMNVAKYSISHKTQFTLSGATKKKLNISVSSWTVFNNFVLIRSSEPFHGTLNLTLNSISINRKIVIITSVISSVKFVKWILFVTHMEEEFSFGIITKRLWEFSNIPRWHGQETFLQNFLLHPWTKIYVLYVRYSSRCDWYSV